MKKVFLEDITVNLDNRRKPLNNQARAKISKEGLYPYYGANNIMDYVDEYIFDEEILCVAEDGGSWGLKEKCSYIVNGKCWVNNHAHVLSAKDGINIKYLYYYLNYHDLSKHITGTTRGKLTKTALSGIEILIPTEDTQNKIVEILDKSQELIDKRKEQMELLDELIQSKFLEMFGNPVINPKGWDIKLYEEICKLITDGEHSTPKRAESGIYLLSARNVHNHYLKLDDVDYIEEDEYLRISKRIVPEKDDILISCSGSVGRACKVPPNIKFQMVRSVAILKLKEDVNPVFMEWLIDSDYTQQQILKSINQSSQANLFQGKIKKLKAIIPPLALQEEFAIFVGKVNDIKAVLNKSLEQLNNNFDSLISRAFKGELF